MKQTNYLLMIMTLKKMVQQALVNYLITAMEIPYTIDITVLILDMLCLQ